MKELMIGGMSAGEKAGGSVKDDRNGGRLPMSDGDNAGGRENEEMIGGSGGKVCTVIAGANAGGMTG